MSSDSQAAVRISEAVFQIVAGQGLERATVREVARSAGVSIGTVQYYFPTKDAMLAGAFADVVRRVRERLKTLELGPDSEDNVLVVLKQILPLDRDREQEARVQLAFAVRALHEPALAVIQHQVLGELHDALSQVLSSAGSTAQDSRLAAHVALAAADGLTLHALSTPRWMTTETMTEALQLALRALATDRPR